ncbi:hypothetical protein INR49_030937 [Caranx melampygus]|nr:hypothetical protein INR49_030937 [Caranx melampygus]
MATRGKGAKRAREEGTNRLMDVPSLVLAPIPPVSWQHPCPDGLPPRPLDHIRALLSSSLQFTLATSG